MPAKLKATFQHKAAMVLSLNHFAKADATLDEDKVVGEDLLACLDLLEARETSPDEAYQRLWTPAVAERYNGVMQQLHDRTAAEQARKDVWETYAQRRSQICADFLPVAHAVHAACCAGGGGVASMGAAGFQAAGASALHADKAVMVHVWKTPEAARNFYQGWSRVWQALLEFRIEGIRAPFSALYCLHGTYVSVTALPPVRVRNAPPVVLPRPGQPCDSVLAYMAGQLLCALHVPSNIASGGVPLRRSLDGAHYLLDLAAVLSRKLPSFPGHTARSELLLGRTLVRDGRPAETFLMDVAVPGAVAIALEGMARHGITTGVALASEGVLVKALHESGVSLCAIYAVQRVAAARAVDPAHEASAAALLEVVTACNTEMVGRVLKQFARTELEKLPLADTEGRLDVINRLARMILTKDAGFFTDHVMPAIRAKFNAAATFEIAFTEFHGSSSIAIMSRRMGAEYSPTAGRFDSFSPCAGLWSIPGDRPASMAIDASRTSEVKEAITRIWNEAMALPAGTTLQRSFVARAYVASLATGAAKKLMTTMWDELLEADSSSMAYVTLERVRISGLMAELPIFGIKKEDVISTRAAALRAQTHADDATLVAGGLLQCALLRDAASLSMDAALCKDAVEFFGRASAWASLPFSTALLYGLKHVDALVPKLSIPQLGDYYDLVTAVHTLLAASSVESAANYCDRAVVAVSWTSDLHESRRALATRAAQLHVAAMGKEHPHTYNALWYVALFIAQAERLSEPSVSLKNIIDQGKAALVLPRLKAHLALAQLAKRPTTVTAVGQVIRKATAAEAEMLQAYVDSCSTIGQAADAPNAAAARQRKSVFGGLVRNVISMQASKAKTNSDEPIEEGPATNFAAMQAPPPPPAEEPKPAPVAAERSMSVIAPVARVPRKKKPTISVVPVYDPSDPRPQWRRQLDLMFNVPYFTPTRRQLRDEQRARDKKNTRLAPKPVATRDGAVSAPPGPARTDDGATPRAATPAFDDAPRVPPTSEALAANRVGGTRLLDAVAWPSSVPAHPFQRAAGHAAAHPPVRSARAAHHHLSPMRTSPEELRAPSPARRTSPPQPQRHGASTLLDPKSFNKRLPLNEQVTELSQLCGISPAQARRLVL